MRKKEIFALLLIFASLVFVFFDLFTLKQAFLSGDHMEQQYPWAKFYQDQIRHFALPWWSSAIHCGFPLLAEGQVGAFYPLNFLFFFFLPTKLAYNGIILFQYFLGGAFFYLYLRRQKISVTGSLFAVLIWLYGSAQGGYFYYNYISQKVVIWLPLILFLTDRLLERKKFSDAFCLSILFAVQIFGGYLQVAVYSLLFTGFYFVFFWFQNRKIKSLVFYLIAGILGIFYSVIQIWPTFELSMMSSRAAAVKEIAYLGSMLPVGLATLFFPSWDGFLGSELYIGVLGLFFVFHSAGVFKNSRVRFFWFAGLLFLLLAMGKYTPVYRTIIEITHFYSFRTPFKFLFFVAFSGAVLAAFGFDAFFNRKDKGGKASLVFFIFAAAFAAGVPVLHKLLVYMRPQAVLRLQGYVQKHIYAAPGHPYSLDYYKDKAANFYDTVIQIVNWQNVYTGVQILIILFTILFVLMTMRVRPKQIHWMRWACAAVLFADLFFYGFSSIRANLLPFGAVDRPGKSKLVEQVLKDKTQFRVMEVYTNPKENSVYPFYPSTNMLVGLDDLGAYSPLVMKKYADFLDGWGYVNDSLSNRWVSPDSVASRALELGRLNVKYVFSATELSPENFKLIGRDGEVFLYENRLWFPRAVFLPGLSSLASLKEINRDASAPVLIEKYEQQNSHMFVETPVSGLLFVSDLCYPGWKAEVDGVQTPIQCVDGLFRSVAVGSGTHKITFRYEPDKYLAFGFASLMMITVLSACILFCRKKDSHEV